MLANGQSQEIKIEYRALELKSGHLLPSKEF
jgi:hypothetical protein